MCGESDEKRCPFCHQKGSPPHVWGKLAVFQSRPGGKGITPTCVGNTEIPHLIPFWERDHPHMCGEYGKGMISHYAFQGSPPHVWGILILVNRDNGQQSHPKSFFTSNSFHQCPLKFFQVTYSQFPFKYCSV